MFAAARTLNMVWAFLLAHQRVPKLGGERVLSELHMALARNGDASLWSALSFVPHPLGQGWPRRWRESQHHFFIRSFSSYHYPSPCLSKINLILWPKGKEIVGFHIPADATKVHALPRSLSQWRTILKLPTLLETSFNFIPLPNWGLELDVRWVCENW